MNSAATSLLIVFGCVSVLVLAQTPGSEYKEFLLLNVVPNGSIPRSFAMLPINYFDLVPENQKQHHFNGSYFIPQCGGNVSGEAMNNYTFQSERWLSTLGLNIYDGAVRCIALSLIGEAEVCLNYTNNILINHKTVQFPDIRGDAQCKGVMEWGQCTDPQASGVCGFCYGDSTNKSLGVDNAYFFRMISDYWAIEGTIDERCPERHLMWIWDDYKPVLGENAWANLIGPIHNAVLRAGGDFDKVDDNDPAFVLGLGLVQGLQSMAVGNTGAYYYTPRNTWFGFSKQAQDIGSTVSLENQASLLAGLQLLFALIDRKSSVAHKEVLPLLQNMTQGLRDFIFSAWDPRYNFFRQGATYDPKTGTLTWGQNGEPMFAVDCQTWVSSVLGTKAIDGKFGNGTAYNLWQILKEYANYTCPAGGLCGVGYTFRNISGQVLSGEWTYGAMNWLKVMMNDSDYSDDQIASLQADFNAMNFGTYSYVVTATPIDNSTQTYNTVLYADSRYWIPFGWYANPLPATASTGWAVFLEAQYNPFHILGHYTGVM